LILLFLSSGLKFFPGFYDKHKETGKEQYCGFRMNLLQLLREELMNCEVETDAINTFCATIEVPPYLTTWDMEKAITKALKNFEEPVYACLLDMSMVKNVYSATSRLIIRVYERATRMGCQVYIINACESVRNALKTLQIDTKIPVFEGMPVFNEDVIAA